MPTIILCKNETISATTPVRAPADDVYRLVADVTRTPEWSPECVKCTWIDDVRFRGANRRRLARWTTEARVEVAEPGREFAYVVQTMGGDFTRWAYRIEPTAEPDTCRLTEDFTLLVDLPRGLVLFERLLLGVKDRRSDLQGNLDQSLRRIRTLAERDFTGRRPRSPARDRPEPRR
jgi:hypothetical protein